MVVPKADVGRILDRVLLDANRPFLAIREAGSIFLGA